MAPRSRSSARAPSSAARATSFSSSSTASEASAAAHAGGCPRKVCVCSASPRRGRPRVHHLGAPDAGGDRHARREPLADAQEIRPHVLVLAREPRAGAAEPGVDLVGDQQPALGVAQAAQRREEARGRHALAAAALDRLDDHRADRRATRPRRRAARRRASPKRANAVACASRAANGARKLVAVGRVERSDREAVVGRLRTRRRPRAPSRAPRSSARSRPRRCPRIRARRARDRRPGSGARAPRAARP